MTLGDPLHREDGGMGRTQGTGDQRSGVSGADCKDFSPPNPSSQSSRQQRLGRLWERREVPLTLGLTHSYSREQGKKLHRDRSVRHRELPIRKTTLAQETGNHGLLMPSS